MNVPVATQLELVLLVRTLESIKSCPGLPIVYFFEELNVHLRKAADLSLSAYWDKIYPENKNIVSMVDVPKEEPLSGGSGEDEQSMIVSNISELDHLRTSKHAEIRHDPLLIIRTLYENALSCLASASPEERTILLTACLLLGMKSGRASLLLHSTLLLYLFRGDCGGIDPALIAEFWKKCHAQGATMNNMETLPSDGSLMKETTLLLSFGKADHGKLGLGDVTLNRSLPTVIDTLLYSEDVVKVASMSTYSLAINKAGAVYIWGTGGCVASLPASRVDSRPQLLDALPAKTNVIDISCGLGHALFLSQDGRVYSWGNGGNGRLGLGDLSDRTEACLVSFPTNERFVSVQCGASHSLSLTTKGQVYSWGKNTQGQCGHGNNEDSLKPSLVKKLVDMEIVQLAAGWEHSLALSHDGKIYSWGSGYKDSRRGVIPPVLGLGHSEGRPNPELISSLEGIKIKAIASGWDHCLALDSAGKLLSWGSGQNGKLGNGTEDNTAVPCYIPALECVRVIRFAAGCEHSAAISEDGMFYTWGHGDGGRLGLGTNSPSLVPLEVKPITIMGLKPSFVHCGDKFTIIIAKALLEKKTNPQFRNIEALHQVQPVRLLDFLSRFAEQTAATSPPGDDLLIDDFRELVYKFQNENEASLPKDASNTDDAISMLLYSMSSMVTARLRAPHDRLKTSHKDLQYSLECCEDSFYCMGSLIDLLHSKLTSSIQSIVSEQSAHEGFALHSGYRYLYRFLLQILLILSANFELLMNCLSAEEDECGLDLEFAQQRLCEDTNDSTMRSIQSSKLHASSARTFSEDESSDDALSYYQHPHNRARGEEDRSQHDDGEDDAERSMDGSVGFEHEFERAEVSATGSAKRSVVADDVPGGSKGVVLTEGNRYHDPPGTLSPAPSYESLQNSTSGNEDGFVDEEKDYYELQSEEELNHYFAGNETENMELQHVLLSSIGSSFHLDKELKYLREIKYRRGGAYLSNIRERICDLAASLHLSILQCVANHSDTQGTEHDRDLIYFITSLQLTWESTQLALTKGFTVLFGSEERKNMLVKLVRSPTSFLHIITGIVQGMVQSDCLTDILSEVMAEDDFFDVPESFDEEGVSELSMLRFSDLFRFVQFTQQLFRDRSTAGVDGKQGSSKLKELEEVLQLRILSNLSLLMLHLLDAPLQWCRKYSSTDIERASNSYLEPWGAKMASLVPMLTDCLLLDIQHTFSTATRSVVANSGSTFSSILLTKLFLSKDINTEWSVSETSFLIPIALKAVSFLAQQGCDDTIYADVFSMYFETLVRFLAHVVVYLSNPPLLWSPLLTRSYKAIVMQSLFADEVDVQVLKDSLSDWECLIWFGWMEKAQHTVALPVSVHDTESTYFAMLPEEEKCRFGKRLLDVICSLAVFGKPFASEHTLAVHDQVAVLLSQRDQCSASTNGAKSELEFHFQCYLLFLQILLHSLSSNASIQFEQVVGVVLNSGMDSPPNAPGFEHVLSASIQAIVLVSMLCQRMTKEKGAKLAFRDFVSRLKSAATNMQQLKVEHEQAGGLQDILLRVLTTENNQSAKAELVCGVNNFVNKMLSEFQGEVEDLQVGGILGLRWEDDNRGGAKRKKTTTLKLSSGVVLVHTIQCLLEEQDYLQGLFTEEMRRRSAYSSANLTVWIAKQLDGLPKPRNRFYEELLKDDAQRSFDTWKDPLLTTVSIANGSNFSFVEDLMDFITNSYVDDTPRHLQDLKTLEALLRNNAESTTTSRESGVQIKAMLLAVRKAILKDIVLIDVTQHLLANCAKARHRPMKAEYWSNLFDKLTAILNVCSEGLIQFCEQATFSKPHSFYLLAEFSETVYLLERILEIFLNGKAFSLLSQFSPDTKAFVSILNLYKPLEYSLRALVDNVQAHFWFGKSIGFQYLCPKTMVLDTCSPMVSAGVCAPQGNFSIAFWLFVPNDALGQKQRADQERIHILSRVPETGELNSLDLLHGDPSLLESYTLSMHVCRDRVTEMLHLELSVITYVLDKIEPSKTRATAPNRKRTIRRFSATSNSIEGDKWVHCLLRIRQEIQPIKDKNEITVFETANNNDTMTTSVQLEVDRQLHLDHTVEGGYWPLHQNVIIGKLPLGLGRVESRETDEDVNIFVKLADVVWIPTVMDIGCESGENLFASFPPSEMVETLNSLFRGSCLLTKVVDSILAATPIQASDSRILSTTLLNNISKLLKNMQTFMIVGCKNTQKTCLWLLQRLFKMYPELYTTGSNTLSSVSELYLEGSPLTPAGSARSAAIRNKPAHATFTTLRLLVDLLSALMHNQYSRSTVLVGGLELSGLGSSFMNLKKIWDRRLHLNRINAETFMNISSWLSQYYIEENALLQEVVSIFCVIKKNWKVNVQSMFDALFNDDIGEGFLTLPIELSRKVFNIVHLACHGGWFPSVRTGSIVDLIPRRNQLFYHNKLPIDQIAFASTAVAIVENQPGSGNIVWLKNCEGLCQSINIKLSSRNVCFPNPENLVMSSTELVPTQDSDITHLHRDKIAFDLLQLPIGKAQLLECLSSVLSIVKQNEQAKEKDRIPKVPGIEEPVDNGSKTSDTFLDMLQLLAKLRSISLLLCEQYVMEMETNASSVDELFSNEVFRHLESIVAIAALEPTEAAATVFESSSFKGIQVDVLRNLLKEGDIYFLEKLSSKMWKQFKFDDQSIFAAKFVGFAENTIQMTALAGEVVINGSKVRAASHFPSVRLLGVGLERMTGRWFYECTLLSDGLMQIGWANSFFRCDPVCGQGVGDHLHSWAFDGLRTKKWNVSCEAYGRRWRLGDTVGVLADMDLLEMRFYLNGEDLGPAFEDFASYEIFPALSLNARQSVRLNFGQYKFLHPPSDVDGKPFRPVLQALLEKKAQKSGKSSQEEDSSKQMSDFMKRLQDSKDESAQDSKVADLDIGRFGASVDQPSSGVEASTAVSLPLRLAGSNARAEVMSPVDEAVNYLAALRSARDNNQQDRDNSNKHSDEEGSERGDRYNSEDEEDEEATESGDQNYVLNSRWQEDLEARIRMEAEDGDDYEVDEEEGQEEDEEEEGAEESNAGDQEEAEEDEENAHLVELRRQAMIENLIGMGFPVDWALRAAEHCEVSTSESAAISWIIERMEMEQSKMNEIEGDSSRAGDGEDYDELESSGIDYLIQRQANAYSTQTAASSSAAPASARGMSSSAAANRRLVAEHMMELLDSANVDAMNPSTNPLTSMSPGSPSRGESFGLRRGLAYAALGMMMNDDNAYSALVSSKLAGKKSKTDNVGLSSDLVLKDVEGLDLAFFDTVPWNEEPGFSPILPGTYTTKRRHDTDKQEVLTQVAELDVFDMLPIVATCEFALCVYYARNIFLRLLQIARESTKRNKQSTEVSFAIKVLPIAMEPSVMFKLMKNAFKQHVVNRNVSDRLFPFVMFGNACGDTIERLPPVTPFVSGRKIQFMDALCRLELTSFKKSLNTIATEDYSIIGMLDLSTLVQWLVAFSTSKTSSNKEALNDDNSSISSSLSTLQDRILQRVGMPGKGQDADISKLTTFCNSVLSTAVESCFAVLERATATKYESMDWISNSMEKTNPLDSNKSGSSGLDGEHGAPPPVLFAFWLLKSILTVVPQYYQGSSVFNVASAVGGLTSAEFLTKLLKLSTLMNDSLRFCLYELCSHILSLVNAQMLQVQLLDETDRQHAALTQIAAAEYYVSVAKEKRLLQSFGNRIKVESNEKLLHSKYTRAIGNFLFQWYLLRRQLNIATFAYLQEFKYANLSLHAKLDPEEKAKLLKVGQISSSSVTVCWVIPPTANNPLCCCSMYITALSYMGMESPILVMANLDEKGTFRIDDLEPDTLYKVSIRKFKREADPPANPENHDELGFVVLSTEGEATFGFQAESVSGNIVISASNPLTLKNVANKKWSTARANVRLSSGVHRWDVHIDRCVSKNIFIGVATREARQDNYVGCDSYGWAFLANKAVWHNKSKIKAYGELFKTGDTVSVILDLDLGTLSFCLNDRPLGVAMDGLVGPLYPAFSLYNEDDQVTVAQVRSMQDSPSSFGSFAAENILDRTEILRALMQYFVAFQRHATASGEQRPNKHLILQDEVLGEILLRWKLWRRNVAVRTIASNGNIISMQSCNESCKEFSQGKLEVGDAVVVEKRFAKVVGVGTHRIWLRVEADGELMAFTQDSLQGMFEKNLISVVSHTKNQLLSEDQLTRINCMHHIDESKLKVSLREETLQQITDFKTTADARLFLSAAEQKWTCAHDATLMVVSNTIAKKTASDAFSLGMTTLAINLNILRKSEPGSLASSVLALLSEHSNENILFRILLLNVMNDLLVPLFPLIAPYWTLVDSKMVFDANTNHPTLLLKDVRNLIHPSVKEQFSLYMTYYSAKSYREMATQMQSFLTSPESTDAMDAAAALDTASDALSKQLGDVSPSLSLTSPVKESATLVNHGTPTTFQSLTAPPSLLKDQLAPDKDGSKSKESSMTTTPPPPSSLSVADKDINHRFVLEVERQDDLALQILWAGHLHGVQHKLYDDDTWNVFSRIQCTYVGQLMRYLELLKVKFGAAIAKSAEFSKSNIQASQWSKSKDPALWEHCFRTHCGNMLSVWNGDETLSAKQKVIPLHIRAIRYVVDPSSTNATKASEELRIQFTLQRAQDSRKTFDRLFAVLFHFERNPDLVSEWNIFSVFVEEACSQVQSLIDVLYRKFDHSQSLVEMIQAAESKVKDTFTPAQVSMLLQLLYSTGVLVGLGFRSGSCPVLDLPLPFYDLMASEAFSSEHSNAWQAFDFLVASAHALRTGICAVYPEVVLDLLTGAEFRNVLAGRHCFGVVSTSQLYNSAIYDSPLSAADPHLLFFWICVYELSTEQLRVLLRGCTFRTRSKPMTHLLSVEQDDILFGGGQQYLKAASTELRLRFMKPTAAAHLNADSTDITLFPDLAAISIPKYSSLKVTQTYLHQLIKSLQMET